MGDVGDDEEMRAFEAEYDAAAVADAQAAAGLAERAAKERVKVCGAACIWVAGRSPDQGSGSRPGSLRSAPRLVLYWHLQDRPLATQSIGTWFGECEKL